MLKRRRSWVFDLDGTLTVAAHDFDAIRDELGLPPGEPILESLARLSPEEAAPLHARLTVIETEIAQRARPQPGARETLSALRDRGVRLGILTRNKRSLAYISLRAAGLGGLFEDADVLGRDEAAPKPSPEGLQIILSRWAVPGDDAVMIGDYLFDLQAGRAAGMATVLFDPSATFAWRDHADRCVSRLDQLLAPA